MVVSVCAQKHAVYKINVYSTSYHPCETTTNHLTISSKQLTLFCAIAQAYYG